MPVILSAGNDALKDRTYAFTIVPRRQIRLHTQRNCRYLTGFRGELPGSFAPVSPEYATRQALRMKRCCPKLVHSDAARLVMLLL